MSRVLINVIVAVFALAAAFGAGYWLGSDPNSAPVAQSIRSFNWAKGTQDSNSPFESYQYPTIKFRAKPVPDIDAAIAQLSTTFEPSEKHDGTGNMKYRLTVFKAPGKDVCEIQMLDGLGFKLMQFDATDFHQIPGAPNIREARDSYACSESDYKRVHDYSLK